MEEDGDSVGKHRRCLSQMDQKGTRPMIAIVDIKKHGFGKDFTFVFLINIIIKLERKELNIKG